MNTRKLPDTDSIQELARFWDTHDLTEYEDQLEEVTEPAFDRGNVIALNLEPTEVDAVRRIAKASGLPEAELIRRWVREKIHAD